MVWVDTHCHLNLDHFAADVGEVIARALEAGVTQMIVPGTDVATSGRAVALAEQYPAVWAAVGVHPNEAAGFGAEALAEVRRLAAHPRVVAIGEIGLDLYWKTVPFEQQQAAFVAQVQLAAEAGKPVIVHDREAHAGVLEALRNHPPPAGAVLHAFSGDEAMAAAAVVEGWYLGVDGPLTYKNSRALQAIFAAVPLERILLETDAPYLTPHPHRGRRNEPAYVRFVGEKLAEIRQVKAEEAARVTAENAAHLFPAVKM